jgi:tripartite-type tricarboxylate transporter receptor subunit TctC
VKDGRLKGLGVSLEKGSAVTPGVPALATSVNIPGFNLGAWAGVMGPAGMPPEVVARLSKAMREVMLSDDIKEVFMRIGIEIDFREQAEFLKYLEATRVQFTDVIKRNNIKLEGT